jgi:hypothetical protein
MSSETQLLKHKASQKAKVKFKKRYKTGKNKWNVLPKASVFRFFCSYH